MNASHTYIILLLVQLTQLTWTHPNNEEIHEDAPRLWLNVPTALRSSLAGNYVKHNLKPPYEASPNTALTTSGRQGCPL